jgi:Flp pilus assembly protein CpaB
MDSNPRARIGGSRTGQMFASRRGALIVAIVAALAAGGLFYVFASHFKNSATPAAPTSEYVFVTGKYIPQGTASATILAGGYLQRTELPSNEMVAGAVTDPSEITNSVTTTSIAAGQQISVADFSRTNVSFGAYLQGDERAIEVPFSRYNGLTAYLVPGDTVDVMGAMLPPPSKDGATTNGQKVYMLAQDITVLANAAGDLDLRVSDQQAEEMAYFQINGKVWVILRPSVNASNSVPSKVTPPAPTAPVGDN